MLIIKASTTTSHHQYIGDFPNLHEICSQNIGIGEFQEILKLARFVAKDRFIKA